MWQQIRANRNRSIVLVIAMGALLLLIGYMLGYYLLDSATGGLIIALIVWAIMGLAAYYQGDNIFLSMAKAKKISREDHPRLYNIVEEMKLASGLPRLPNIYIIDDPALNAFATGRDPEKASVAVTTGLLKKLNRDELQGVIAHEMAHIKNRDVLLMTMTGVMLGAIVMLSWYASRMMLFGGASRGRSSSGGGGGAVVAIVAIALMILAPIAARFIYFAISRKREYLADASSALYTRYPDGLAGALEKIGASTQQLKAANNATAPMYIANPFRKKGKAAANLSSTHPPLSERIHILRSMGGGVGYSKYEESYEKIHKGSGGLIPATALAGGGTVGIRAASESKEAVGVSEKLARSRETNDAVWRLNQYKTIDCPCGTRLRAPSAYQGKTVRCPHCGRNHMVK